MPELTTPTRLTVPGVLAWPTLAVTVVFIAGWLYSFAGVDTFGPWWLAVSTPVIGTLGTALVRAQWPDVHYGPGQQRAGVWLAWTVGAEVGAWLVWAGLVTPGRALPLLLLGALPVWGWFAILSMRAPKAAQAQTERYERGRQVTQERSWRNVLDRAGCDDVVITEVREHRAGVVLVVEPDPDARRPPTYDEFAGRARGLATQAAMHYRRTGAKLPRNSVRTEPGEDDAEFLLHITTKDVFAESTKYVPDYVPGDITNALDLGEFEDASRLLIALTAHMKIVGATGSGKSNLANNIIGRITGTANALVWVTATDKLLPLVWPWLRPWFEGKTSRPVLDYVAGQDAGDVLRLLRAAYRLACERNARLDDESKMRATSDEPVVFVFHEEVSHSVQFPDTIETHDGQVCTIPDLLTMIAQNGRSANVRLILMSQYGINAALGDRASELIRNLIMRICLRTMEAHDGSRTLPALPATVNTTTLANYTMYVQPSTEEARAFPAKAAELDGAAQVEPVAVGNSRWTPRGVEPEVARLLGWDYATRWAPERLPILASRVALRGWTWPTAVSTPEPVPTVADPVAPVVPEPVDTADDEVLWGPTEDEELAKLLGDRAAEPPAAPPAEPEAVTRGGLPDFEADLARLRSLADGLTADAAKATEGEYHRAREPRPLSEPLASVVGWLDSAGVPDDAWVRTEELAFRIEYEAGHIALGRVLGRYPGIESTNVPREYDARQRKGYTARMLREAGTRYRFGE